MGLTLYYYRFCPSCKTVLNVLKLLGIEAELKHLDLRKKEQLQAWFLELNPEHTVPVLVDNELIITESRPIMTYLVNQYGLESALYPNDAKLRAKIDNWLYFDHGSLTPVQRKLYFPVINQSTLPGPDVVEEYEKKIERLEKHLATSKYFVGDRLTLADIAIYVTLYQANLADYTFEKFSQVQRWQAQVKSELAGHKEIIEIPMAEQKASVRK